MKSDNEYKLFETFQVWMQIHLDNVKGYKMKKTLCFTLLSTPSSGQLMKQKKVERQASCMKQKTFVQGKDKDEFHDSDH